MPSPPSNRHEERNVLDGLLRGGRPGARRFLEVYGGVVRGAVRTVNVRSAALDPDDLYNAALGHIFANDMKVVRAFTGGSKFSTYLHSVSRRYALDMAEKEHRRSSKTEVKEVELLPADPPEEELWTDEEKKVLREGARRLDPNSRILLRMLFVDTKSTKEVMHFFGWNSENTVYAKKNKTIAKLRKIVRKILLERGGNS